MNPLQKIKIELPNKDEDFTNKFLTFLSPVGDINNQEIEFKRIDLTFIPKISIEFNQTINPTANFIFEDQTSHTLEIINYTGKDIQSPHVYTPVDLSTIIDRLADMRITSVDHVGFNMPWFEGVHPDVKILRQVLKNNSLYYLYPNQPLWDFILPGKTEEINNAELVDFTKIRRPKFEIVSFNKSSTPLIQIDLQINRNFDDLAGLFPESILEPKYRNIWVYVKNNFGLDICLVIGQSSGNDWSEILKDSRLV
jgi:hypothetical protein